MEKTSRMPRIRTIVVTAVFVLIGLVWFSIAAPDRDWLWFLPVFREEASRIHLYRDGQEIMLQQGDWGYEEVNKAINQTIRGIRTKETQNMSLDSQQEYYNGYAAVEVFYTESVLIHTRHNFPKADKFLFPQTGPHHNPPVVFAGMQEQIDYRDEVLVLTSRDLLDEAVDAVWKAQENE